MCRRGAHPDDVRDANTSRREQWTYTTRRNNSPAEEGPDGEDEGTHRQAGRRETPRGPGGRAGGPERRQGRRRPGASGEALPPDGARTHLRDSLPAVVPEGQDRRLPAPLHRRGGGGGRLPERFPAG